MRGLYRRGKRGIWWVDTTVAGRPVRRSTGETNRRDAEIVAARLLEQARAIALGDRSPTFPQQPISDLIADYLDHLEAKGDTAQHVGEVESILRDIAITAQVDTIGQLNRGAVERGLERWTGKSPRTRQKALSVARSWFRWLQRTDRWDRDPTAALTPPKLRPVKAQRRALMPDELDRLLEVAPVCRSLVYRVAATTGLRRSELLRLEDADVDLDAALLVLPEHKAKGGGGTLPLPVTTVEVWRAWLADPMVCRGAGLVASERVLPEPPRIKTYRADLKKARVELETPAGRLDFHSLRVTFGTHLAMAGVTMAMAQKLLRHSDPRLTANIYTRFAPHDVRAAAEGLDRLMEQARNTGDDRHARPA